MKLSQNWVGYLDRSYQQIKNSVIARLVVNNPEITDHNESNIFIMIVSMFSGIAEMLNYYIDVAAREAYLGVALKFTNVIRLVKLIDYNVKANRIANVDLLFTLTDSTTHLPYSSLVNFTIPKDTVVTDSNGIVFRTLADATILPGQSGVYAAASQWQDVTNDNLGTTDGTALQQVLLPSDYADGSMNLNIDGEIWLLYKSAGYMLADTKGFIIQVQDDNNAYIVFGDGVNGLIPAPGFVIYGTYKVCKGDAGNLAPNAINQLQGTFVLPVGVSLNATNPDYSNNGGDFEDIEEVRNKAPRSIRTLERAVTYQDYIDVAILHPQVGDAAVSYCCGKFVQMYIAPKSKGTATLALLADVLDWMNCRKMITTKVQVSAAGISKVWIKATIYANPFYTENQVLIEVINLLDSKYGYNNASINDKISVSDIVSLVESGKTVQRIDVANVQVLPYIRPVKPTLSPLDIEFVSLPKSNTAYVYTLIYKSGPNLFQVLKGGAPQGTVGFESTYTDGVVSFIIHSASYVNNDKWQFSVVPSFPEIFPSTLLAINDFSIPIIDIGPLVDDNTPKTIYSDLTVVTQQAQSNCLPPCP